MKIKKKLNRYYFILLFIVAAIMSVYLMPIQGKFKYEYQKGTPWAHENLIAPFDFAILKSDQELKHERDSILAFAKPYFIYDETVGNKQITKFIEEYPARYKEAVSFIKKLNKNYSVSDSAYDFCKKKALSILSFIYEKGVVDYNEIHENTNSGTDIVILKNKIAKNRNIDEVFTQKIAYEYISKTLKKDLANKPELIKLIENLKIYDFVSQNLFFDKKTTEQIKNELLSSVPTSKGMIQQGERIISKGDVIHEENYRVLESLRKEYENLLGSNVQTRWLLVGHSTLIILSFVLLYFFLYNFRREILEDFSKSLFILIMVMIMVGASALLVRFDVANLYVIPYAALPIIIYSFYDSRLAFYIHMITVMIVGFWAPNAFEFIYLQFVAGAVSVFSIARLHRRGQLFVAVTLIFLSYSIAYTALALMQEGSIFNIDYRNYLWFAGNSLLLLAAYPLIFLFEKLFGFLSDVTLLELSDTNHPALRELAEKAPGTFHHVIQVANLAEEAIRVIGGNALLIRVGALYHDIGKTANPAFFIENLGGGSNPHDSISCEESAEIIIQHVHQGGAIARKFGLPNPVIDFIYTHHGTGLVRYFFIKYQNNHQGEVPDISKFAYPGPSPFSKETAVLMMADVVEASSRTLNEYTEASIDDLVERRINDLIEDHQFDEADITFKDIYRIKSVFKQKLLNIYHSRIKYPDKNKHP